MKEENRAAHKALPGSFFFRENESIETGIFWLDAVKDKKGTGG